MTDDRFQELRSLPDISRHLYRLLADWHDRQVQLGDHGSVDLPLELAEPGPLMVRAVEMAGPDGLTRRALFELFDALGEDRTQRGIDQMKDSMRVLTCLESRPNAFGRPMRQTVYRAVPIDDESRRP